MFSKSSNSIGIHKFIIYSSSPPKLFILYKPTFHLGTSHTQLKNLIDLTYHWWFWLPFTVFLSFHPVHLWSIALSDNGRSIKGNRAVTQHMPACLSVWSMLGLTLNAPEMHQIYNHRILSKKILINKCTCDRGTEETFACVMPYVTWKCMG